MERLDRRSAPAVVGWGAVEGGGGARRGSLLEKGVAFWLRVLVVVVGAREAVSSSVRDSGGGGVSSSTCGRSGSTDALSIGETALPLVLEPEMGLPCAATGVDSAERPRMIPSSTSRFFASVDILRAARTSF